MAIGKTIEAMLAERREPAIWFRTVADPVSRSRWGGLPSLPAGIDWPVQGETAQPLHFIAQIDLAALPATPLKGCKFKAALPGEGMLFFFFDCSQDMIGDGADEVPSVYSRVIYCAEAGPDRAAPDNLPMIGHASGAIGGDYAKDFNVLPERHLRAYTIDTFWAPGYFVKGAYVQPFENREDAEAKFQSILRATGEDAPVYPTFADVPAAAPSYHIFLDSETAQRKVEYGPQMFGAEQPWQVNDEAPRDTKKVLLLELTLGAPGAGSLQFVMKTSDLKARRFERVFADAYFS